MIFVTLLDCSLILQTKYGKIYHCIVEETKYQKGQKMMRNVIQIWILRFPLDILEKTRTHFLFNVRSMPYKSNFLPCISFSGHCLQRVVVAVTADWNDDMTYNFIADIVYFDMSPRGKYFYVFHSQYLFHYTWISHY